MSSKSNDQGRAFEYACIIELKDKIEARRPVTVDNKSVKAAKKSWNTQSKSEQQKYLHAAAAFISTLFLAEPRILECDGKDDIVILSVNKDSDAKDGDVRDIVIARKSIRWDIGLSLKHNHFAVKHSRLSSKIDFGAKWYGLPCSQEYWNSVNPIFARLDNLEKDGAIWRDLPDKKGTVYFPIVEAFIKELNCAYNFDPTITSRLISYLLGIHDFYKVIAVDKNKSKFTEFQPFNLRGNLNKKGKNIKPALLIPNIKLPTKIKSLCFKTNSKSTAELYMNNGWALSFRIHNASTFVEPSLKFDVNFLETPKKIESIKCYWN